MPNDLSSLCSTSLLVCLTIHCGGNSSNADSRSSPNNAASAPTSANSASQRQQGNRANAPPSAQQAPAKGPQAVLKAQLPAGGVLIDGKSAVKLKIASPSEGEPGSFSVVTEDPADVEVKFEPNSPQGAILQLTSKFKQDLKLRMFISPDGEHFLPTSSCPLNAGLMSFEHWQHPVPFLYLASPKALAPGSSAVCE